MNNSIVKLEDFELDEISGGITAKQVAKKTAGYAIKGLCTAAFATVNAAAIYFPANHLIKKETVSSTEELSPNAEAMVYTITTVLSFPYKLLVSSVSAALTATTLPLSGVAGWKLGELICNKIGLED